MDKDKLLNSNPLLESIVSGLEDGKGQEIVVMDLRNVHASLCDFFVVCHANSTTQTESIARKTIEKTQEGQNEKPWRSEGFNSATWILLDYVNIVVHIFHKDTRSFYEIEDLWADAEVIYLMEDENRKSGT